MMKLILLTMGQPAKNSPAKEWAVNYQKKIIQLFPQLDFEWQFIKTLPIDVLPNQKIISTQWVDQHLLKESELIDKHLDRLQQRAPLQIVILDKTGSAISSEMWALAMQKYLAWDMPAHLEAFLQNQAAPKIFSTWIKGLSAQQQIVFLIGGPFGLHPTALLKKWANQTVKISLGPITLPHDLALVLCLEQLYRALSIVRNEPYHVLYNFSN